jgi:hypothetical protein
LVGFNLRGGIFLIGGDIGLECVKY